MMFAARTANLFPLPGKKSAEINEMLLVIYPTSGKPIDQTNYALLLDFAKEYMMMKLTEKCENYLILSLEKEASQFPLQFPLVPKKNFKCLELLNIGQSYGLDRLQSACIERAMSSFKFQELATEPKYKNISVSSRERVLEGRLEEQRKSSRLKNKL